MGHHIGYDMDNKETERELLFMYSVRYIRGHIEVYGADGSFLFSADNMGEVHEMMEE